MNTLQAELRADQRPRDQGTRHQDGLTPGFEPAQAEFRAVQNLEPADEGEDRARDDEARGDERLVVPPHAGPAPTPDHTPGSAIAGRSRSYIAYREEAVSRPEAVRIRPPARRQRP